MFKLQHKDELFRGDYGQSTSLDVKALGEAGEFEGYASVFGMVDQGYDMIMAGAFADSLITRPAGQIRMLYQHDSREVIGKYLEAKEDTKGLYVKGKLNLNVQRGRETYELMKDGSIDGVSIGYRSVEDEMDRALGVRRLKKVDLFECSIVTFPMDTNARIGRIKTDGGLPSKRDLETWLARDAGLSVSQAKAFIADGYKALKLARDAGTEAEQAAVAALAELAASIRS